MTGSSNATAQAIEALQLLAADSLEQLRVFPDYVLGTALGGLGATGVLALMYIVTQTFRGRRGA